MGLSAWQVLDKVESQGHGPMEDAIQADLDRAWVIDGATSLTSTRLTAEESDGLWLVKLLNEKFRRAPHNLAGEGLTLLLKRAIDAAALAARAWPSVPVVPPSAAVGIAALHDDIIEYLVLGDVTLVLAGEKTRVISDNAVERTNQHALNVFTSEVRRSRSYETARAAVENLLFDHRAQSMNRQGGYWIASLDDHAAEHALTGHAKRDSIRKVLLCSDGFARLVELFTTFASWDALLRSKRSLHECVGLLRAAEMNDPNCVKFPRWSVSDDASAILLGVPTI